MLIFCIHDDSLFCLPGIFSKLQFRQSDLITELACGVLMQ